MVLRVDQKLEEKSDNKKVIKSKKRYYGTELEDWEEKQ